MQSTVSERLREYLFISKKNVKQLAGEINVSQASLNNVVNGKNLPSSNLLIRLAQTKGVSIDWVLLGEGNMLRNEEEHGTSSNRLPIDRVEKIMHQFQIASQDNKEAWSRLIQEKDDHLTSKERIIQTKDSLIELLRKAQ